MQPRKSPWEQKDVFQELLRWSLWPAQRHQNWASGSVLPRTQMEMPCFTVMPSSWTAFIFRAFTMSTSFEALWVSKDIAIHIKIFVLWELHVELAHFGQSLPIQEGNCFAILTGKIWKDMVLAQLGHRLPLGQFVDPTLEFPWHVVLQNLIDNQQR